MQADVAATGIALRPHAATGCVGPNAVIQLMHALRQHSGEQVLGRVFEQAALGSLIHTPPAAMIDESVPARLFGCLWDVLPPDEAFDVAFDAGRRTADYILAHRIPQLAQLILRALPASAAAPLLLRAIEKNAWTFAGSGTCTTATGKPAVISIRHNPLAMPSCIWHQGVFQGLFEPLVSPHTRIMHPSCCVDGHGHCRFELRF